MSNFHITYNFVQGISVKLTYRNVTYVTETESAAKKQFLGLDPPFPPNEARAI
ncbi:uncharacterized protein METZ01_LOCUS398019 [marine metagenome]|uniref:Uncharacterized protein n=1 Tax=marine metagenome TaxID=408172 RepID=A0A382VGJ1_9ZZZZ